MSNKLNTALFLTLVTAQCIGYSQPDSVLFLNKYFTKTAKANVNFGTTYFYESGVFRYELIAETNEKGVSCVISYHQSLAMDSVNLQDNERLLESDRWISPSSYIQMSASNPITFGLFDAADSTLVQFNFVSGRLIQMIESKLILSNELWYSNISRISNYDKGGLVEVIFYKNGNRFERNIYRPDGTIKQVDYFDSNGFNVVRTEWYTRNGQLR